MSWEHCGKRRKWWSPAFSSFSANVLKSLNSQGHEKSGLCDKELAVYSDYSRPRKRAGRHEKGAVRKEQQPIFKLVLLSDKGKKP